MQYQGLGSRDSPIAIEDSEEEVLQELQDHTGSSTNTSPSSHTEPQRPSLEERLANVGPYEHPDGGAIAETSPAWTGKRKRADSDAWKDLPPPMAQPMHPLNGFLPPSQMPLFSKKARKRQKRAEKQAMMQQQAALHYQQILQQQGQPAPSIFTPLVPTIPQRQILSEPNAPKCPPVASTSTSAWVTSMAHVGGVPVQYAEPTLGLNPHAQEWYPPLPLPVGPSPPVPELPTRPNPPPVQPRAPPPKPTHPPTSSVLPPKPSQPPAGPMPRIGMEPEQGSSSIHGLFDVSSHNGGRPYQPNPARTLVMEQLPKQSRNKDFMNSWSKKTCGAYPTSVLIDAPHAKALMEFSTAEQARKCWGSPRMGQELIGLPAAQLKGKPRVDLIKVWWYRLPGMGADSGVGEIEEGEIEDDEEEIKEVELGEVKPRQEKETKKQRKARLARERAEKERHLKDARGPLHISTSPNSTLPHDAHASPIQVAQSSIYTPISPTADPRYWMNQFSQTNERTVHPLPTRPRDHDAQQPYMNSSTSTIAQPASSSQSYANLQISSDDFYQPSASPSTAEGDIEMEDMELDSPEVEGQRYNGPTVFAAKAIPLATSLYAQPNTFAAPQPRVPQSLPIHTTISMHTPSIPVTPAQDTSKSGSPVPSEPRAMKNAPKAPSYTKRALMAKQKELEQQIAQHKQQLGMPIPTPSMSSTSNSAEASPVPTPLMTPFLDSAIGNGSLHSPAENQAMEERLRSLVLKSRLSKLKSDTKGSASPTPTDTPTPPSIPSPAPAKASTTNNEGAAVIRPSEKLKLTASIGGEALSVDDLAASFIAETIQTVQIASKPINAPPPPPANLDSKAQLAARQRQLEQHIAQSKVLMDQLTKAKTKQEKDRILAIMRQRSRLLEEGTSNGTDPSMEKTSILNSRTSTTKLMPAVAVKWPQSHHDAGILIISDDEESDAEC